MDTADTPLAELRRLRKTLARAVKRRRTTLEKQRAELAETGRAGWYRQIADSLLAGPPAEKGASETSLFNIHTQKEETVALNPKLDSRQNAALFYRKARKGERGRAIALKKTAETEAAVTAGQRLLAEADDAAHAAGTDHEKTQRLCAAIVAALARSGRGGETCPGPKRRDAAAKTPFRHLSIDGWDIFVGKNAAQNDELTTRFARPPDLWLHAAGHAGSHVLVRRPGRAPAVPPDVLRKAASLAAWFSKAKHTSYAEVHYAEARFVRKRRHAPPGEVVLERYQSIRVSPCGPERLFPSKYAS
jgi:predicted ribosome quality control (RQC) complex YloA/Tae2 family protein